MKNYKLSIIALIILSSSVNVHAFDIGGFFKNLWGYVPKAGEKAGNDPDNEIDIDKLLEPNRCRNHYPWGAPTHSDKELNKRSLYICRESYALQYDTKTKTALWSSEVLSKNNLERGLPTNTAKIQLDPFVPKKMQATIDDFYQSGYDLGHLTPAINMIVINDALTEEQLTQINKKVMEENYYITNIIPQVGINMNRGIWSELEILARKWAIEKNEVFVTTGPLYLNGKTKQFIGKSNIAVPTHFYKVITHPQSYGSIAYIIPNKEIMTLNTKEIKNKNDVYYCQDALTNRKFCELSDFIVSINEVERLTGLKLYPLLAPHYAVQVKQNINELFLKKKKQ